MTWRRLILSVGLLFSMVDHLCTEAEAQDVSALEGTIRIVLTAPALTTQAPVTNLDEAYERVFRIDNRASDLEFVNQLAVAFPAQSFGQKYRLTVPLFVEREIKISIAEEGFRWDAVFLLDQQNGDSFQLKIRQDIDKATGGKETQDSTFQCRLNQSNVIRGVPMTAPLHGSKDPPGPRLFITFGISPVMKGAEERR